MVDVRTCSPYERLCEGNARFVMGELLSRDHIKRRSELLFGQQPFAGVITCSDSRVVPEYLFDVGLGELFVVRNAGNVVDVNVLASMEYAVQQLDIGLIVVLGHERCGAINAACAAEDHEGNLAMLMEDLGESVLRGGGDPSKAVVENVWLSMERLRLGSEHLRSEMDSGRLTVKGAVYSLDTGVVRWIN